jgi:hypothetical protein
LISTKLSSGWYECHFLFGDLGSTSHRRQHWQLFCDSNLRRDRLPNCGHQPPQVSDNLIACRQCRFCYFRAETARRSCDHPIFCAIESSLVNLLVLARVYAVDRSTMETDLAGPGNWNREGTPNVVAALNAESICSPFV